MCVLVVCLVSATDSCICEGETSTVLGRILAAWSDCVFNVMSFGRERETEQYLGYLAYINVIVSE